MKEKYIATVPNMTIEFLNKWWEENISEIEPEYLDTIEHLMDLAKENVRFKSYLDQLEKSTIRLHNENQKLKKDHKNLLINYKELANKHSEFKMDE